jgi:hypothetical protein
MPRVGNGNDRGEGIVWGAGRWGGIRRERWGCEPGLIATAADDDICYAFEKDVLVIAAGKDTDFASGSG